MPFTKNSNIKDSFAKAKILISPLCVMQTHPLCSNVFCALITRDAKLKHNNLLFLKTKIIFQVFIAAESLNQHSESIVVLCVLTL
jgi:hypothetical protein